MSIPMTTECYLCRVDRHLNKALSLGDDATAVDFARELLNMYATGPKDVSAPYYDAVTMDLYEKYYHLGPDPYKEEKKRSNAFVMERLDQFRKYISNAEDRVYAGLQMAILGNYIDYGALKENVSFEKLDEMLEKAHEFEPDREVYKQLCSDLASSKELLYLTDNAGEICFDRLFMEAIHEKYPELNITVCVRGGPTANDATREDAAEAGIEFPVIDNGNLIAGTQIEYLGDDAKTALARADVVLAKGQGNCETMYGCKYNVYYAFLIKCSRFEEFFGKPFLAPMLVREAKQ